MPDIIYSDLLYTANSFIYALPIAVVAIHPLENQSIFSGITVGVEAAEVTPAHYA